MRLVIADIDERRLAGAGESLRSRGHRAAGFTCDVREQRDMSQLRDFALDAFEDVYLVCLNAGGALPVSARSVTDNELADVLRLNHYGAINGVGRSSR